MNAIVLKWLSMSLIGTVVLSALWLAGSVRGDLGPPILNAQASVPVTGVTVVADVAKAP